MNAEESQHVGGVVLAELREAEDRDMAAVSMLFDSFSASFSNRRPYVPL